MIRSCTPRMVLGYPGLKFDTHQVNEFVERKLAENGVVVDWGRGWPRRFRDLSEMVSDGEKGGGGSTAYALWLEGGSWGFIGCSGH
jgi:hypothetical protein